MLAHLIALFYFMRHVCYRYITLNSSQRTCNELTLFHVSAQIWFIVFSFSFWFKSDKKIDFKIYYHCCCCYKNVVFEIFQRFNFVVVGCLFWIDCCRVESKTQYRCLFLPVWISQCTILIQKDDQRVCLQIFLVINRSFASSF